MKNKLKKYAIYQKKSTKLNLLLIAANHYNVL